MKNKYRETEVMTNKLLTASKLEYLYYKDLFHEEPMIIGYKGGKFLEIDIEPSFKEAEYGTDRIDLLFENKDGIFQRVLYVKDGEIESKSYFTRC